MHKDLHSTMERHAHTMDDSRLDLAAVMAEGERRVRRRRWTTGVGVAAAAGALAVTAPFAWNAVGDGGTGPEAQVAGQEAAGTVWASGSKIHAGNESVDVGHEVHAFVATSGGYVFVDPEGGVWSWQGGTVTREGTTHVADHETQLLVSDGAVAAWLDTGDEEWSYVAIEQRGDGSESTGSVTSADVPEKMRPTSTGSVMSADDDARPENFDAVEPGVRALVDGDLVAVDARGIIRIDLGSGEVQTISDSPGAMEIEDGEGDQLLVTMHDDGSGREATYLTDDIANLGQPLPVRGGDISPGGAWVMSENSARNSDDFTIVDVATGETRAPAAKKQFDFFTGFAWVDGDRYVAIGMDSHEAAGTGEAWKTQFLECDAAADTCATEDGILRARNFQLPIGLHIDS